MNWFQALVLGAVQGLTEFLPVSSSGHLSLFQTAMGIAENPLLYDTLLHVGTLIAVCVVLRREILALLKKPLQPLTLYLVIATVPAVLATLLFGDQIDAAFRSTAGMPLGIGFLVTAAILFVTPLFRPGKIDMEKMGPVRAFLIGVAQAVAILPSISRSGATIVGGVAAGVERDSVARFSFLMSIPAILGSVVYQAKDLFELGAGMATDAGSVLVVLLGVAVAAATGYLAIRVVFDVIKKGRIWVFGVYTAVLGALVILDSLVTHVIFKTAF